MFQRVVRASLVAGILGSFGAPVRAAEGALPDYLRDRGNGVASSQFGIYVRERELVTYLFLEGYSDHDFEYQPHDFGEASETDFRGRLDSGEALVFVGYGLGPDLLLELEAAGERSRFEKSPQDPSPLPKRIEESGLGDVETQLRWRFARESERRPEGFLYFETVFPLQRHRRLIGTHDWEFALGAGLVKGFSWGTLTVRAAAEYAREEGKVDAGEYAVEYLRQLTPRWRLVALVEGSEVNEISLIPEVQWRLGPRAVLKLNCGFGLTRNATDLAPEIGVALFF